MTLLCRFQKSFWQISKTYKTSNHTFFLVVRIKERKLNCPKSYSRNNLRFLLQTFINNIQKITHVVHTLYRILKWILRIRRYETCTNILVRRPGWKKRHDRCFFFILELRRGHSNNWRHFSCHIQVTNTTMGWNYFWSCILIYSTCVWSRN